MAKKNKEAEVQAEETVAKLFKITSATLNDDLCNYSYEITDGIQTGDTHSVKGKGIVEADMRTAFHALNVHLAIIDDIYEHKGISVDSPEELTNDESVALYHVTGFQVKGSDEDESVIIKGTKYVSSSAGRLDIVTPKIPLGDFSSYKWHNELKAAVDNARNEVELYKGGKCVQPEQEIEDPNQMKISFGEPNFEEAKV